MSGTFQGVGTLQFTPDNKHAFAYSGIKTIAEAAFTNALQFETGSYYLIAELSVDTDDNSTNNHFWNLYYNNTAIVTMGGDNSRRNVDYDFGRPIKLVIPPFTNFKLEGKMTTADIDWTIVLTADVKGTIEQLDLRLKNE